MVCIITDYKSVGHSERSCPSFVTVNIQVDLYNSAKDTHEIVHFASTKQSRMFIFINFFTFACKAIIFNVYPFFVCFIFHSMQLYSVLQCNTEINATI